MNFLEALEKLKNEECEGIKFQNSIMFILRSDGRLINECDRPLLLPASSYLSDDWTLVKPKPVYKEEEVEIWYNTETKQTLNKNCTFPPIPESAPNWVLMKGTQKIEVKPKVKKRKEVNVDYVDDLLIPTCARFFAEWDEDEAQKLHEAEINAYDLPIGKSIIQTIIDDLNKNGVMPQYFKNPRKVIYETY